MGIIKVAVETENGAEIASVSLGVLRITSVIPYGDESMELLRCIDPYDDVEFDESQMEKFLREWDTLSRSLKSDEVLPMLNKVKQLALRCQGEPGSYLKFYSD